MRESGTSAVFDYCLAICIFTPLVVGYWRGTWQLLDLYLWPVYEPCYNSLTSFTVGVGTITVLTLAQDQITKYFTSDRVGKTSFFVLSRCYTIIFAFVGVNHWRGVWNIMVCHAGIQWSTAGSVVAVSSLTLAYLRALKSAIAPPFAICVDEELDYFKIQTIFKSKVRCTWYHVVDVIFTIAVAGSLVVTLWWGVWMLLDTFVFPESILWSAVTCISVGIAIAITCFISQSLAARISRNIPFWPRVILEDIYLFIAEIGAINLWRGIWILWDLFFIPDDPYLSNAVTSCAGMTILIIIHSSNSILVKGVLLNLHLSDGSGCHFHTQYIDNILTTFDFYHATKSEKEKEYEPRKQKEDLKNYAQKDSMEFSGDGTTELLWIPRTVIANGKLPDMSSLDQETVV